MKKKSQFYRRDFKMPHLFRDDLEEIENIIKDELTPGGYKLDSHNFEYKDMQDIQKDTENVNEFHVQTDSPHIMINFDKSNAEIYSGTDDIKTTGAIKKIVDIILKRERKYFYYFVALSTNLIALPFLASILLFAILLKKEGATFKLFLPIVLFLVTIIWLITAYNCRFNRFSRIEFLYRKDRSSFFIRNKDQIILVIIGAVLGAIATMILEMIFR